MANEETFFQENLLKSLNKNRESMAFETQTSSFTLPIGKWAVQLVFCVEFLLEGMDV